MQCHYEVLEIPHDADVTTIKKAHRKKAIQRHPDKNLQDPEAADTFRLVQEAYECLSDPSERKWYDDHRQALLKGWTAGGNHNDDDASGLYVFHVLPYMHAHCYNGYEDDGNDKSFYKIYGHVFASIAKEESDAVENINDKQQHNLLPYDFGNSQTPLPEVAAFYQAWEGFVSSLTFAWADQYDLQDADHRRIRRAMEDENKKARKVARKARKDDIVALVRFVKRRDPRVAAWKEQQEVLQAQKTKTLAETKQRKKQEAALARQEWRQQAELEQAQAEELDRLAGRVRLADLEEEEDDYEYAGKKKKGKKKKGGNHNNINNNNNNNQEEEEDQEPRDEEQETTEQPQTEQPPNGAEDQENEEPLAQTSSNDGEVQADDNSDNCSASSSEEEEEEEPDFWRCECCKKDFKSQGQMDNHMNSKKHKDAYKKYQKKMEQSS